jgi:hypothetical protein
MSGATVEEKRWRVTRALVWAAILASALLFWLVAGLVLSAWLL